MAEIIKECDNCKHAMTDTESFPCNRCKRNAVDKWEPIPKKTNADRIRSMSDEELAEFLIHNDTNCKICSFLTKGCVMDCSNGILEWLQSEAE